MRDVEVEVKHYRVVAVLMVPCQKLLREISLRGGIPVILPIELREAESPVHMLSLHRVRQALDKKHLLIGRNPVRIVVVSSGGIRAIPFVRGADVESTVKPSIGLYTAAVSVDRLHQRIGLRVGRADGWRSAYRIIAAWKRRRIQRTIVAAPFRRRRSRAGGEPVSVISLT